MELVYARMSAAFVPPECARMRLASSATLGTIRTGGFSLGIVLGAMAELDEGGTHDEHPRSKTKYEGDITLDHVALKVSPASQDEIAARLDAAARPYRVIDHGYCRSLYVTDPDGLSVESDARG